MILTPGETRSFWQETVDVLLAAQDSTTAGLTSADATARLKRDGPNMIVSKPRLRLGGKLVRKLGNPLIAIMLVAAAAAGATGDPASFAIIAVVVVLSTTLDLLQEHRAEGIADALRRSIALTATALRDGQPCQVPVTDVVRGDIVRVAAGDLAPADGILIEANHLQVNEALLTGEAFPVAKAPATLPAVGTLADATNALFAGTSVVAGTGTMLIVATGGGTAFGAIAGALDRPPPPTAFERDIHRFGLLIVRLTVFLVAFVLLANLALGRAPIESFLFATALAVGLTPELLPMVMTVALAHGARRMAAARVVVKRLSAIHDLGEMDVLCTDKTGTLTEAKIALIGHPGTDGRDDDRVLELAHVNAAFETGLKSPLDEAILTHPVVDTTGWTKLDERPFDFERRRVSVLAERNGERIEIVKGAPEALLAIATATGLPGGSSAPLDDATRQRLVALHDGRAAEGSRLLAVAWKPAPGCDRIGEVDSGLIFAGYCVFIDPAKPGATSAVARLARAGVAIKIVSGDAAPVVAHLVKTLGLPLRGMATGDAIGRLDDAALTATIARTDLFARVTPDQKTRIVRLLADAGHRVGFIGDGINDAPAIRQADVGLSVDGATDVAREAADMILLDHDLGVVADGVMEGRRTYANVMKYVRMGTSSNFGNMVTMALASVFLPFLPLTATQVLINNLIYDVSQTGVPLDRVDPAELSRPRAWDMAALTRFTAIMGLLSTVFDIATFAVLLWLFQESVDGFRTGWFIESMASQILVVFVIRTTHPLWRDRPHRLLTASALFGMAVALVVALSPARALFGFGALSPIPLATIAALVAAYLGCAELLKGKALAQDLPRAVEHRTPASQRK